MDRQIYVDEISFYLKSLPSNYRRIHCLLRIRNLGHYTRSKPNMNVIMVVESGCNQINGGIGGVVIYSWHWMISQRNLDQYWYADFINNILHSIKTNPAPGDIDDHICFIWDNLSYHNTPYVTNVIYNCPSPNNFITVNRPPYRPKIVHIVYVFCKLANELSNWVQAD